MDTKRCSGWRGVHACGEEYPDHELPLSLFGPDTSSKDGLDHKCGKCMALKNDETNPSANAISAKAYRMAGGIKAFYKLPKEERLRLRALAKGVDTPKTNLWNNTVLPFIKRGGKGKPMTTGERVNVKGERVPEGWVYAIRNPDYPYVLKIGKTYPDGLEDRLSEARRWGRAELVAKRYASDAIGAEKFMHMWLAKWNLRNLGFTDVGMELFKCSEEKFHLAFTDYLYTLMEDEDAIG